MKQVKKANKQNW